jgi:hypothetical protein
VPRYQLQPGSDMDDLETDPVAKGSASVAGKPGGAGD